VVGGVYIYGTKFELKTLAPSSLGMSDSLMGSDYLEYTEKLSAERKKRDLIDIKIRKVVETNPPLDLSDEKKKVDHWTNQIKLNIQGIEKKIANCNDVITAAQARIQQVTLQQEQVIAFAKNKIQQTKIKEEGLIQLYQSYITEHESARDSKSTRPYYELQKAEIKLELKKNHKPKDLQKLEIDLEVIDKKIESFKNLLGMSKEEVPLKKRIEKKDSTPTPPAIAPAPGIKRAPKAIAAVKPVEEPLVVERPDTPVPEPVEFVSLPEPMPTVVAVPPPVAESREPKVIQNTKVKRLAKIAPSQ